MDNLQFDYAATYPCPRLGMRSQQIPIRAPTRSASTGLVSAYQMRALSAYTKHCRHGQTSINPGRAPTKSKRLRHAATLAIASASNIGSDTPVPPMDLLPQARLCGNVIDIGSVQAFDVGSAKSQTWASGLSWQLRQRNGFADEGHGNALNVGVSQPTRRQNGKPFCPGRWRGAAPLRTRSRQRHGTSA